MVTPQMLANTARACFNPGFACAHMQHEGMLPPEPPPLPALPRLFPRFNPYRWMAFCVVLPLVCFLDRRIWARAPRRQCSGPSCVLQG